jgi:hypothetical protein
MLLARPQLPMGQEGLEIEHRLLETKDRNQQSPGQTEYSKTEKKRLEGLCDMAMRD